MQQLLPLAEPLKKKKKMLCTLPAMKKAIKYNNTERKGDKDQNV